MNRVSLTESFQWAQGLWPVLKQFENDGVCYYQVLANHADIKNRNGRVYTDEQLKLAAASLSERPLNINHDDKKILPFPENQVLISRYENGIVECIIQVADATTNKLIESGEISHVSIEGMYLDGSKNTSSTEYPTSLHFQALALLTRGDQPGDPDARILRERIDSNRLRIPAVITESIIINYGDQVMSQQLATKEAEWTDAFQNTLPDSSFAYIQPGGKKDDEGKTVPRQLRRLPYKDADGKPDASHVRNALSRLPQSDIPDEAKAEANKKLQAAAKELGIETKQMQPEENLLEKRIANIEAKLDHAVKKLVANSSPADRDAVVDPARNEDGTYSNRSSKYQQNQSKLPASETDVKNVDPVQNTKTNVEIGREIPDEGSTPKVIQSLQMSTPAQVESPNKNFVGVGNPNATIKPKMEYPESANPLGITNQNPSQISDGMKVTKASSLMDALTNASTNMAVKVIPAGVSESEMRVTNQSSKSETMSAQESTQVKESVSSQTQSITVRLEGASEIKQAAETLVNAVKESQTPRPHAKVSGTEATQAVEETFAVKEKTRLDSIARILRAMVNVKEDIASSGASGALGQVWSPDMIVLPADLPANLRRFVQVKEIPKGSKQVNFTTITTPAFASLTEDTAPSDISQTISEISVTPSETGAKQRVSYQVMESATPDVVQAVERAFQAAALIDEDSTLLTALDGATPADTLYGDESVTAEASITSSMTFAAKRLASAMREIQKKGYSLSPGDLIAVLHPVQYDALLKDTAISQYLYFGSAGPIQQGVIPQVYGVDVVRSTKVPTGTGAGSPAITTYHAQVFLKASAKGDPNGLGVGGTAALGISRDLMIETWRKIDERALYIVASHRVAAGVLQSNALVHVYTA